LIQSVTGNIIAPMIAPATPYKKARVNIFRAPQIVMPKSDLWFIGQHTSVPNAEQVLRHYYCGGAGADSCGSGAGSGRDFPYSYPLMAPIVPPPMTPPSIPKPVNGAGVLEPMIAPKNAPMPM